MSSKKGTNNMSQYNDPFLCVRLKESQIHHLKRVLEELLMDNGAMLYLGHDDILYCVALITFANAAYNSANDIRTALESAQRQRAAKTPFLARVLQSTLEHRSKIQPRLMDRESFEDFLLYPE